MTIPVLYDPSIPPRGSKTHTQCDDAYSNVYRVLLRTVLRNENPAQSGLSGAGVLKVTGVSGSD